MNRSARLSLGSAAVVMAAVLGTSLPAQAFTTSSCNGRTYDYILGHFTNPGHSHLPLRCGNSSFGLIHIIKRGHLNATTSTMIQTTLTYGEQKDAGAKELFDGNCHVIYTVAYGYNAYQGTDQKANPIGIITAYPPDPITTVQPNATDAAARPAYRQDCAIFDPIGD